MVSLLPITLRGNLEMLIQVVDLPTFSFLYILDPAGSQRMQQTIANGRPNNPPSAEVREYGPALPVARAGPWPRSLAWPPWRTLG